ncbi:MAG: HAD hydrolase family protein, partial [Candidatus Izimaplasma sp.]|nr:HAD hydrolase family protein [Candidatus Izimaplasma bacterium]
NSKGGLKEKGIEILVNKLNIDISDVIVIGDGYNDISMMKYVKNSVAMGNAHDDVKKHASIVTDHISDDGLYKAFVNLKLI